MTAANEAPAPQRIDEYLRKLLEGYRRVFGRATYERGAILLPDPLLDRLQFECHGLHQPRPLLHAAAEFMGLPVEPVGDYVAAQLVVPGGEGWDLFIAQQGRRLARLALERFPTTSSASRQSVFHRERPDQPSLELAMVRIAERIAW